MNATLSKWYEEHVRHWIFAGGRKVGLQDTSHKLELSLEHVNAERNHTLDDLGIAKTAREEKIRARDAKLKQDAENARMAALYRKEILKEAVPEGGFVPLGSIAVNNASKKSQKEEAEPVMGD